MVEPGEGFGIPGGFNEFPSTFHTGDPRGVTKHKKGGKYKFTKHKAASDNQVRFTTAEQSHLVAQGTSKDLPWAPHL